MRKSYLDYLPICNFKRSSEANVFYVYGLISPISNELRYIGQAYNLRERMSQHCKDLRGVNHKINWVKSLKNQGLNPIMIILEKHNDLSEVLKAEIDLIAYYTYIGCNLVNETDGGEGRIGSEQKFCVRQQISRQLKITKSDGRENIEDDREEQKYIKDIPIDPYKRTTTQYAKDIASKTHKGKTMSEESRKKISDGLSGENHPFWGKKMSVEHRLNMAKSKISGSSKKLSFEIAEEIRSLYATGKYTLNDLGEKYKVSFPTISKILNNKRYKREIYLNAE